MAEKEPLPYEYIINNYPERSEHEPPLHEEYEWPEDTLRSHSRHIRYSGPEYDNRGEDSSAKYLENGFRDELYKESGALQLSSGILTQLLTNSMVGVSMSPPEATEQGPGVPLSVNDMRQVAEIVNRFGEEDRSGISFVAAVEADSAYTFSKPRSSMHNRQMTAPHLGGAPSKVAYYEIPSLGLPVHQDTLADTAAYLAARPAGPIAGR